MKPKFKVGQTVQVVFSPETKVFILEILEQTCYADVAQNWYHGRVFSTGRYGIGGGIGKIEKFSEIELRELATPSAKLKKLVVDLKKVRVKKEALIKEQRFEDAATTRVEEQSLKAEIDIVSAEEGIVASGLL